MIAAAEAVARSGRACAIEPLALDRLRHFGGDPLLAAMAASFLAHAPERIGAARAAAAGGDCDTVRAAAHSLKSSAGQIGASVMQRLCEQTETLAADGVVAALPPLVAAIQASFGAAAGELLLLAASDDHTTTPPTTRTACPAEERC